MLANLAAIYTTIDRPLTPPQSPEVERQQRRVAVQILPDGIAAKATTLKIKRIGGPSPSQQQQQPQQPHQQMQGGAGAGFGASGLSSPKSPKSPVTLDRPVGVGGGYSTTQTLRRGPAPSGYGSGAFTGAAMTLGRVPSTHFRNPQELSESLFAHSEFFSSSPTQHQPPLPLPHPMQMQQQHAGFTVVSPGMAPGLPPLAPPMIKITHPTLPGRGGGGVEGGMGAWGEEEEGGRPSMDGVGEGEGGVTMRRKKKGLMGMVSKIVGK